MASQKSRMEQGINPDIAYNKAKDVQTQQFSMDCIAIHLECVTLLLLLLGSAKGQQGNGGHVSCVARATSCHAVAVCKNYLTITVARCAALEAAGRTALRVAMREGLVRHFMAAAAGESALNDSQQIVANCEVCCSTCNIGLGLMQRTLLQPGFWWFQTTGCARP